MIDPTLPRWQYRSRFNMEHPDEGDHIVDMNGILKVTPAGCLVFENHTGGILLIVNPHDWVDVWENPEDRVVVVDGH